MPKKHPGYPRTVVRGGKVITFTRPVHPERAAKRAAKKAARAARRNRWQ